MATDKDIPDDGVKPPPPQVSPPDAGVADSHENAMRRQAAMMRYHDERISFHESMKGIHETINELWKEFHNQKRQMNKWLDDLRADNAQLNKRLDESQTDKIQANKKLYDFSTDNIQLKKRLDELQTDGIKSRAQNRQLIKELNVFKNQLETRATVDSGRLEQQQSNFMTMISKAVGPAVYYPSLREFFRGILYGNSVQDTEEDPTYKQLKKELNRSVRRPSYMMLDLGLEYVMDRITYETTAGPAQQAGQVSTEQGDTVLAEPMFAAQPALLPPKRKADLSVDDPMQPAKRRLMLPADCQTPVQDDSSVADDESEYSVPTLSSSDELDKLLAYQGFTRKALAEMWEKCFGFKWEDACYLRQHEQYKALEEPLSTLAHAVSVRKVEFIDFMALDPELEEFDQSFADPARLGLADLIEKCKEAKANHLKMPSVPDAGMRWLTQMDSCWKALCERTTLRREKFLDDTN